MTLEETFKLTASHYADDPQQSEKLWQELEMLYSGEGRYYHTLQHLDQLLAEILMVKDDLSDLNIVLFALFYHDAIYDVLRTDNEGRSASLAGQRMQSLGVPKEKIQLSRQHILSTKTHRLSENPDSNFFTDADLSILGKDPETYKIYNHQIRLEYSIYPDQVYFPGRKKVLEHFLQMDNIFKTVPFRDKYEQQARRNIAGELRSFNNF